MTSESRQQTPSSKDPSSIYNASSFLRSQREGSSAGNRRYNVNTLVPRSLYDKFVVQLLAMELLINSNAKLMETNAKLVETNARLTVCLAAAALAVLFAFSRRS
ncbi:hypothetical protein B0H17DRAFT_1332449 [Mycena rosella]|uniref:Uncharacterized protein n=1 Tax=Mycena rosella TaxID=1033263 RepID=A0AAD7GGT4_MYCRO|nr:hypothetical protein B0H17DRAFT_1332449 [Mycena rosella]